MTLIVAFGHQSGVGKNTCANIISEQLNALGRVRVAQAAFADGVKETAYNLFRHYGMKTAEYYERNRAARDVPLDAIQMTPIQLWVGVGDRMRDVYRNVWIDCAIEKVKPCAVGLITDLRYRNEAESVQREYGVLVKVVDERVRPRQTAADHDMDEWQSWDWTITNNGTLYDLRRECAVLTNHLVERLTSC